MALEILLPSLISEQTAQVCHPRPLEILYPHTDPRGQSARTLTADDLARPVNPLVFIDRHHVTRSNKQRGTNGEK